MEGDMMPSPTDRALDDVSAYQRFKRLVEVAHDACIDTRTPAGYFGPRPLMVTDREAQAFAPSEFSDLNVMGRYAYDVFVQRPMVTEWEYASSHKSATAAWTAMNMARRHSPALHVKMLTRPHSAV